MDVEKAAQLTHSNHKGSVVIVRNLTEGSMGRGSGFIIRSTSDSCLVMTCYHVVSCPDPSEQILYVRFPGETKDYEAEVLHIDCAADLAIIRVQNIGREHPVLQFGNSENILPDTPVFLLGYAFVHELALNLEPGVSPGETSAPPQNSGLFKNILCSCTTKVGFSGSPLLMGDKVIGVHFGSEARIMYARATETVVMIMKDWLSIDVDDTKSIDEMVNMLEI